MFGTGRREKVMASSGSVAPPDLIRRDFAFLDARETLRTSRSNEELLLIQSILGRAHEGHGTFRGRSFPNTVLDDVVRALRLDPMAVMGERQSLIDEVRAYARAAAAGMSQTALVDENGTPLIGVSTLRFLQVNPIEVLRGLYLGGLRDDPDIRAEAEKETGLRIGGGRCYFVDFTRMEAMGLTAEDLAHGEWEAHLDMFRQEGLIVDQRESSRRRVYYQYIRHRKGDGASDDAAIAGSGFLWGLSVALGVFLADAVDTLEKYVPRYSDQDEDIALEIEQRCPNLGVGRREVKLLIRVAVATGEDGDTLPDSSLRHLLSIDRDTDLCAIEAHILAVQGTPAPVIGLGHERMPSDEFYAALRKRLKGVEA